MTSADVMRFFIIVSLGVVAFITFLVAGTIIGLMWLDTWRCATCYRYPVGMWILGLLGILFLISIAVEASDAPTPWRAWLKANWTTVVIVIASVLTVLIIINWWWWFGRY